MTRKVIITVPDYPDNLPVGTILTVVEEGSEGKIRATVDNATKSIGFRWFLKPSVYRDYIDLEQGIMWRDATPEQKGALLLAFHENDQRVEYSSSGGDWITLKNLGWMRDIHYRLKPKSKIEVEDVWIKNADGGTIGCGTVTTINGKPDFKTLEVK